MHDVEESRAGASLEAVVSDHPRDASDSFRSDERVAASFPASFPISLSPSSPSSVVPQNSASEHGHSFDPPPVLLFRHVSPPAAASVTSSSSFLVQQSGVLNPGGKKSNNHLNDDPLAADIDVDIDIDAPPSHESHITSVFSSLPHPSSSISPQTLLSLHDIPSHPRPTSPEVSSTGNTPAHLSSSDSPHLSVAFPSPTEPQQVQPTTRNGSEEKGVWFLTKSGGGKAATPCVVRAMVVRDVGTKIWVRYRLQSGGTFVWEGIAAKELWRIKGAKGDRELTKDDFRTEPFAVKRQNPPTAVLGRVPDDTSMTASSSSSSSHFTSASASSSSSPSFSSPPSTPFSSSSCASSSSVSSSVSSSSASSALPTSTPISSHIPVSSQSSVREVWFPEEMTWSWITTARIFTVKRIPRVARLLWADVLTKTLQGAANDPDDDKRWRILFALPKLCLRLPRRGGKKKQKAFDVAPFIMENLQKAKAGEWITLWQQTQGADKPKSGAATRDGKSVVRDRVVSLVEDGEFAKAVEALDSHGMHKMDDVVLATLRKKHPQGRELPEAAEPEKIEEAAAVFAIPEVKAALNSFRNGTAPGGSQARVSFLKDALTIPAGDADERLSGALTEVINLLAKGIVPDGVAPWIAGAPLYPLRKKDSGVRPVAVGEVLRRLVAKCFCTRLKLKCEELFTEVGQVGVGVRGGAEAAVIAVRTALQNVDKKQWTLKVDLENAYNSIDRQAILSMVHRFFPELTAWYRLCYGTAAKLYCEGKVLPFDSSQGVQQGDPLGPLLFALGLWRTCKELKETLQRETLSVWFLDDGTIVGEAEEVARAWNIIKAEVQKVGLKVNMAKCELIPPRDCHEEPPIALREIPCLEGSDFELLGAPVGGKQFCEDYLRERVKKIQSALNNLEIVDDPQVELLLIRYCLAFPRFVFCMRSVAPEDMTAAVREFDCMISSVLRERLGILVTKDQETQARLPVALGGLGVLKADDATESAYLGNILATRQLVRQLLQRDSFAPEEVKGVVHAFEAWKEKTGKKVRRVEDLLDLEEMQKGKGKGHPQRVLTGFVHQRLQAKLLAETHNQREGLRLRAVAREGAGAWWDVVPVRQLGLKLDRDEFLALVKWWLGVPVYANSEEEPPVCPEGKCGEEMDLMGDHSVTCKCGPSRIARHDAVNKAWAFALKGAGLAVQTEVYTDPGTLRRSADTLVNGWEHGRSAAHDWVVTHALQKTALDAAGEKKANFALEQAEVKKDSYAKRRCEERGLDFIPMAMDTFGGVGSAAKKAINVAVSHARIHHGNALYDRTLSRRALLQRLQVAVMRGVARQLLRRMVVGGVDEGVGWG